MSKLIAPIHLKWMYRPYEVAHIIKLVGICSYWFFDLTKESDDQNVDLRLDVKMTFSQNKIIDF